MLAMLQSKKDFAEKVRHIALQYGLPQGRSATFADAQLYKTRAAKFEDFGITIVSDYALGTLDGLTLERTQHSKAALVNALEREVGGALKELANTLSHDIYRNGEGIRGVVASGETTATITLTNREDVYNFEVGMQVEADTGVGTTVHTGSAEIIGIDPDAGTLTTTAAWDSLITTPIVAGDNLFVSGDAREAGALKKVSGFDAWNPYAAPAATAFFGVDRTAHNERLAGVRLDGSAEADIKTAITKLLTRIRLSGGRAAKPDYIVLHPEDLESLLIDLQGDRTYEKVDVPDANVSFDAVTFASPVGRMKVIEDKYMTKGYARALQMDTWTFHTLNDWPRIIQHDGKRTQREGTSDGVEFRAVYRGQLACDAPNYNGIVLLP
jgi:hypothetical protein